MTAAAVAVSLQWDLHGQGFFSGRGTSSEVPGLLPVAINGRAYLVDTNPQLPDQYRFRRKPLPVLREQADTSTAPGEHSVSFQQFWRRSIVSWHLGAGQSRYDSNAPGRAAQFGSADDSVPFRFNDSKGVDPWTKWQVTLLNDTSSALTATGANVRAVTVGAYVYVIDGNTVKRSNDLTTWVTCTGTPAAAALAIASDGLNVWVSFTGQGVWTAPGTAVFTQLVTGTPTCPMVAYVNGRLMVADSTGKLFNIISATPAALPGTALLDLSARGWTWTCAAGGQTALYIGGYSGDKSLIYKTALPADGVALATPVVAVELPDGELCYALEAYLGFVAVGTSRGAHLAEPDSNGYLTLGAEIPTTLPVRCFEGQSRFLWFGLSNLDTVSTGLARMDLRNFVSPIAPAHASDLMATAQGEVLSVITFGNQRVFTVAGVGVFAETLNTPVASGWITTGLIAYGIGDNKVAVGVDLRFKQYPTGAAITVGIAGDGSTSFDTLAQIGDSSGTSALASTHQLQVETFELKLTLYAGAGGAPTLTRAMLRARPVPKNRPSAFVVPLLLSNVLTVGGATRPMDVREELEAINGLLATQQIFTFQYGTREYQAIVNDYDELPEVMPVNGQEAERVLLVVELYEIIL